MKIVTLIDNMTLNPDLHKEFGLSFSITFKGNSFLFDTGSSEKFISNARSLGVDISKVDVAVLSHQHSDHTGGVIPFLEENTQSGLYIPPQSLEHIKKAAIRKYGTAALITSQTERFFPVEQVLEIYPHVYIIKCRQWVESCGDPFWELALVFDQEGKLVVFSGCSHQGIGSIVREVAGLFPEKPIKAVIGGCHLSGLPAELVLQEVEKIAALVSQHNIENVYSGHCTGEKASNWLKERLGEKFSTFYSGFSLDL